MAGRQPSTGPPTPDIVSTPSSTSSKVAIPRLKRDSDVAGWGGEGRRGSSSGDKNRTSHACEPCRTRKTKCNGERPSCRHCLDFKITCYYGDGKRERAKNEIRYLQERVDTYEKALETIYASGKIDNQAKLAIVAALRESSNWERIEKTLKSYDDTKNEVSAQEGSRGFMRLDKVADDFGGSTDFPHSYLGTSSDMSWLQTIIDDGSSGTPRSTQQTEQEEGSREIIGQGGDIGEALETARATSEGLRSYHLDDLTPYVPLPSLDECFGRPERKIADTLLDVFFSTVQLAFPIVFRPKFMKEYESYMVHHIEPQPIRTWLASLNTIMAIGSFYSQLTDASWKSEPNNHLAYLGRAKRLFFCNEILFNNPDQRQVQALGLLGIYLLATKQVNRCWNVVGLAIRNSYSLGLHLSSDLTRLNRVQQEIRYRKFYTLMSLERLCGILTGRPTYMDDKRYNIPALSGINEDALSEILEAKSKTTEGSQYDIIGRSFDSLAYSGQSEGQVPHFDQHNGFFSQSTKLYKIGLEILNKIYCAGAVSLTWREVEQIITSTTSKLQKWKNEVPADLFSPQVTPEPDLQVQRKKVLLYLDYLNTLVLLNWPCLCRVKAMEAAQSRQFNRAASIACVTAALDIIKLLPDDIRPTEFWAVFPWWIVLYYIVSSGMIVMMEMTLQAEHIPDQKELLMASGKKVLRWLNYMGQTDLAARRSCKMLTDLMTSAAPHIGHTYNAPEYATGQTEQQPQQDAYFLGPENPGTLFGHNEWDTSSPQAVQGFDPLSGASSSLNEFFDSSQHHTLLGVPGINILARTGYDNIGLLSSFPFQTIADDPTATLDPMQLGSTDARMWNWQGFPVPPSHSEGHTPSQEFSQQIYPIGSSFTPGYPVYDETTEDYRTSEVEQEFTGTSAPSPSQPLTGDPHYQQRHHPSQ
ncbi:hypothetical protein TWF788_000398 [Orbilia oligospora]|uniref:Zn(2)-C6 fungal-type domain-containing protein n=1 Tax=Orbilia oligospora TaxID=2813651 RepID=A0A7C8TZY2_ORBOL|nr:hypothetical protein TWF788_000398 [Orbilia oligospora]KAF3188654.1 hypothetical protein TWF788_000398 [Orbilia oligospora]KAF3202787.1 hypothetical protein TWF191_002877 [Orbilia oligospora]